MHFVVEQVIQAGRDVVEAAFWDATFYQALGGMEALATPEVQERRVDEGDPNVLHLKVRYAFAGHLAGPVRAVIDPAKVTWVDHSTFDRGRHRIEFNMVPEHYEDRFSCSGSYRFEEEGEATRQIMDGVVVVRYPLVGVLVERGIVLGLRQHLVQEAEVLVGWASGQPRAGP